MPIKMFGKEKTELYANELSKLCKDHNGLLHPKDVVESARSKDSILHDYFCWNNTEAGERYRLYQAQTLIQVTVTVLKHHTKVIRAFVSLTTDRGKNKGGYRTTVDVLNSIEMRNQLLEDALNELNTFKAKYGHLRELAEIFSAIDSTTKKRRTS